MEILFLGGTRFLGRHCVSQALARGWTPTLFHRGQTGRELFPDVRRILGDRDGDLSGLDGRWDAVVDLSGQSGARVAGAVAALAGRVGHYTYVSSVSVYRDHPPGQDEDGPLADPCEPHVADFGHLNYAGRKAAAEGAVRAFAGPVRVVRPGLIVGPWDDTERFTYWVRRGERPGPILCPGDPAQPIQVIHAGDLAAWILDGAAAGDAGIYNAVGPVRTLGELVDLCAPDAEKIWVPNDFLTAQGLEIWSDLPLWLTSEKYGFLQADGRRAAAAGLSHRTLAEIVADTREWARANPPAIAAGIDADREAEILAAWQPRGIAGIEAAYTGWAATYDSAPNPTRDLDAQVLRQLLPPLEGLSVLELGCGTGKNTGALLAAAQVTALDLTEAMLDRARARHHASHLTFLRADLREPLPLAEGSVDLVTVDLVFEHLPVLAPVHREIARVLRPGGRVVIVAFHPERQRAGKGAWFTDPETGATVRVETHLHGIAEHVSGLLAAGLRLEHLGEWGGEPPRLISLVGVKSHRG